MSGREKKLSEELLVIKCNTKKKNYGGVVADGKRERSGNGGGLECQVQETANQLLGEHRRGETVAKIHNISRKETKLCHFIVLFYTENKN